MTTYNSFSEFLNSSTFIRKLIIAIQPIYVNHLKKLLQNGHEGSFNSYGTEKEQYLKQIMTFVGTLQSYFEDLEMTVAFLKIDKPKIPALYSDT
jgi:hypothetical protein